MKCLIEFEALNKHRTSPARLSCPIAAILSSSHTCNSIPARIQPVSGGAYCNAPTREGETEVRLLLGRGHMYMGRAVGGRVVQRAQRCLLPGGRGATRGGTHESVTAEMFLRKPAPSWLQHSSDAWPPSKPAPVVARAIASLRSHSAVLCSSFFILPCPPLRSR